MQTSDSNRLAADISRQLPSIPKPARQFAKNLIELLENDVMNRPILGSHPIQHPARLISQQIVLFERAMANIRADLQ